MYRVSLRTVQRGNLLTVSDAKQTCTGVSLRTVHQGNLRVMCDAKQTCTGIY